jgi:hypothetical protein
VETTKQRVETTSQRVETTKQRVETTSQPVEMTKQPVETTNQPVETTNQPVETTKQRVEMAFQRALRRSQVVQKRRKLKIVAVLPVVGVVRSNRTSKPLLGPARLTDFLPTVNMLSRKITNFSRSLSS